MLLAHLQAEEPSIVKLQTLQSPLDPGPQHVSQLLVVFHGQVVALVLLAHLQAEEPSVAQLLNLHPLEILFLSMTCQLLVAGVPACAPGPPAGRGAFIHPLQRLDLSMSQLLIVPHGQVAALVLLAHSKAEEPSIVKLQYLHSPPPEPGPQHVYQLIVVLHGQVVALVLLAHLQAEKLSVVLHLNLHPLETLDLELSLTCVFLVVLQ